MNEILTKQAWKEIKFAIKSQEIIRYFAKHQQVLLNSLGL
jgi:hypothetical protein